MLASQLFSEPIHINSDSVAVLCVENKQLYRNLISACINECPEEIGFVFSQNFKPIKFKGNACFVNDFYNLNLSSSVLKKIYENISLFCNVDLQQETINLKSLIATFLEKIMMNYEYDFTCDFELDLVNLFKIQDLKPNISTENLCHSLLDFLVLLSKYSKVKCFILLNMHLYFTDDELTLLFKEFVYNKLNVLVLENNCNFRKTQYETVRIIDEDLCEIIAKE